MIAPPSLIFGFSWVFVSRKAVFWPLSIANVFIFEKQFSDSEFQPICIPYLYSWILTLQIASFSFLFSEVSNQPALAPLKVQPTFPFILGFCFIEESLTLLGFLVSKNYVSALENSMRSIIPNDSSG